MSDRIKRIVAATVLLALAVGICFLVPMPESKIDTAIISETTSAEIVSNDEIMFSHNDYFYTEGFDLQLTAQGDVEEIFYTLDSTPPSSESGIAYTEPLTLEGRKGTNIYSYTVKACGKYSDGSFTEVYTHSYFIGKNVYSRFDTMVFSLSTDPYNLYDEDYGIFTPGTIRKEYMEESGDRNPEPPAPANYNMRGREWERPVYVEILDSNGQLLAEQNAGMRAFGGYSRAMEQKSIKLYARSEYDPVKKDFDVDFFGDDVSYSGQKLTESKRIVLRNSANDNPFGFIRDESIQECAELTSLYDIQDTKAAAVFLNGEYYGFVWVHQVYDEEYLDDHNNINTDDMPNSYWTILSGGEHYKDPDEEDEFDVQAAEEYDEMYTKYSEADLTDDEIFEELCSEIDIENFLTYYAVQIYVNNGDWPGGNYKVYRLSGDTVNSKESPTADGKWRWLLYDTDFGMGLYDSSPSEQTLGILLGQYRYDESRISTLLISILQREDMKIKFAEIMCDLMNHSFSPVNVMQTVRAKEAERMNELEWNFKVGGAQLKGTWSSLGYVSNEVQKVIDFATKRPEKIREHLEKYLGIENVGWTVKVKNSDEANITVNSCKLNETNRDFNGFYFNDNTVEITAKIAVGKTFDYWLVNGEKVYEQKLVLDNNSTKNDVAEVQLFTKEQTEDLYPVITMVDYETGADCVEITNPYTTDLRLKYFCISENPDDPYRQQLPGYVLKAGESVKLYCKNYSTLEALGGFQLDFNLKPGETITISDKDGVKDRVFLPNINNESVIVRDMIDGEFYWTERTAVISE